MAWYNTGTVAVINNSPAVTGTGTAWLTNVSAGMGFRGPDRSITEVLSVNSDTSITLASTYAGTTASGQAYSILPTQDYIRSLAAQVSSLINSYSAIANAAGAGKFSDGTAAAPGITWVGDAATGFYRPAANQMAVALNGINQATWTTTGLGLGMTPANKLDVTGSIRAYTGSLKSEAGAAIATAPVFGSIGLTMSAPGTAGNYSPAITFDIGGGGGRSAIYTTRSGGAGGRLVMANESASGVMTQRLQLNEVGLADFTGTHSTAVSSTSIANESAALARFSYPDPGTVAAGYGAGIKVGMVDRGGVFLGQVYASTSKDAPDFSVWLGSDGGTWTEAYRVNSAYKFLIGTSSPAIAAKLHVSDVLGSTSVAINSTAIPTGNQRLGLIAFGSDTETALGAARIEAFADSAWTTNTNTPAYLSFSTTPSGSATRVERARIDSAGNVGIGNNPPVFRLDVSGPNGSGIRYKSAGTVEIVVGDQGGLVGYVGCNTAHPLTFATAGTERARIDAGGSLLVGTTSAASASVRGLQINSVDLAASLYTSGATGVGAALHARRDSTGNFAQFVYGNWTSMVGSISTTGTATAYNTSSDRRLKHNIAPAGDSGAVIDAIEVVQHDWKADGSHVPFGFIAQDLFEVCPLAVTPGDSGDEIERAWGVDTSKLVALLVKEVQSLRVRVAALESSR